MKDKKEINNKLRSLVKTVSAINQQIIQMDKDLRELRLAIIKLEDK